MKKFHLDYIMEINRIKFFLSAVKIIVRRSFSLSVLLEVVDSIINIADIVFLDLALFAVGEDYLVFFFSNLILVLSFFWRLEAIVVFIKNFN
jgi:hypothetical protein